MENIGEVNITSATVSELEWKIPEFVSLSEKENIIYNSSFFSFAGTTWYFGIRPNGFSSRSRCICLNFSRPCCVPPISLDVSFSFRTVDGKKYRETNCTEHTIKNGWERYEIDQYLSKSELLERKSELLPSNYLTILCTVKHLKSAEGASDKNTSKCSHCKDIVDAKDISSHEQKCVEKPIKCPECSEVVTLKNWYEHECQTSRIRAAKSIVSTNRSAVTKGENETAKCSHCKAIVDDEDVSSHEQKCLTKPIMCPECSEVVALKNWYEHECQLARVKVEPCTSGLLAVLPEKKLLLDFKELFINKEDCDVVIKVKEEEFPAHKAILKARSSVFKSTFRTDMKEKATGVVEIDDCDPSCFSNFLCFMYCGDEGVIFKENVFSLFTVADKYDVQDLREKCMAFMKENLTVDTFCDTITVALRHSETELVKLATDFFIKNAAKIVVTVKWQLFSAENPTQSNELTVKLLVPDTSQSK